MPWTDKGFQVEDFDTIMQRYYNAFIAQEGYSDITFERFVASKEYEQYYASAQIDMSLQLALAESFNQIQTFVNSIGFIIGNPETTANAIVKGLGELGYDASLKPMTAADAGNIYLAIDYSQDDKADQEIAEYLKGAVVGGVITNGAISHDVTLANGQQWTYNWDKMTVTAIKFRTIVTVSRNNIYPVESEGEIAEKFNENYSKLYRAGLDIEPEKYLEISRDLPYAAVVLTEYSLDDGVTWVSDVLESNYKAKYSYEMIADDVTITYEGDVSGEE